MHVKGKKLIFFLLLLVLGWITVYGGVFMSWFQQPDSSVPTDSSLIEATEFPWREAMFYETLGDDSVQCLLCFRECVIPEGERGFCRNRENHEGVLYSIVHGRPSAINIDPIEKEPLYHFLPGSKIFCIGTAGCNFRCSFCQNWSLSQRSVDDLGYYPDSLPEDIIAKVKKEGIPTISFTYNEPTSAYEYLYDVARKAQENGIKVIFHSNGGINAEPLRKLLQYVDAVTIDLKGFTEQFYQEHLQSELGPVLQTLKIIREEGVWLEIVNLIITGRNDDLDTIRAMCKWIVENLGSNVPLHFSRFFPSYQLTHVEPTPISILEEAQIIAREVGLNHVSIGNVPGHPGNSTYCPNCNNVVIERIHFSIQNINLKNGSCSECGYELPGVWQ